MIDQKTLNEFDTLYENTYSDISKYVVCNCSNIKDVEDIIQNIYIAIYRQMLNNKEMSQSYILGIAKNKVKDYYRFKYKDKIKSLLTLNNDENIIESIPSDFDLEDSFTQKYDTDKVWHYLKKKKVIISKIFYLYYYMGLSIKEISNSLNITESNVKHYLYRTLKELNVYLESEDQ